MRKNLPRIIPRPLSQAVASTCLSQIANEEYPPGTNLPPEGELAQEFGVSRIVIREAIRTLSAKGVVAVRQGRNTVVNPVDHWNQLDPQILLFRIRAENGEAVAQDLVEIRKMLEMEAAGLAAVRATEEDIATQRELLAGMIAAVPDATMHSPLENQFHTRIWHAANNSLLLHLLKTLGEVFGATKEGPEAPVTGRRFNLYNTQRRSSPLIITEGKKVGGPAGGSGRRTLPASRPWIPDSPRLPRAPGC